MDYRQGTCGSCKSTFRVPATFTANKAKCPKCGGTVELGAAQSPSGEKAAVAAPPRPVPASVPASRPAAAPSATPAKPSAPAPKPAAAKPSPAKPASVAGKESVRVAAETAAKRVKAGAAKPVAAAKLDDDGGDDAGDRKGRGRRAHAPQKKKSWGPMIGALAGLVVVVAAIGWYFGVYKPNQNESQAHAASGGATAKAPAPATTTPIDAAAASTNPAGAADAPDVAAEETPTEPVAKAEEPAKKPPAPVEDIDLSLLADQEKLPQTSDADWQEIQAWVATFTDPSAGAAASRAGKKLVEKGKEAFPAILNAFKRVDMTNDDGFRVADLIQRELLMRICNGNNFGWKYQADEGWLAYDKKAIRLWFVSWEQARDNDQAWAKLAKIGQKPAEEGAEGGETPPKKDDLDDF